MPDLRDDGVHTPRASATRGASARSSVRWRSRLPFLLLALGVGAVGCDELATQPEDLEPETVEVELSCTGSAAVGLGCAGGLSDVPEGMAGAIIGGQDLYVELKQHAFTFTPDGGGSGGGELTSEISVKNLTQQALGTTDGSTLHADGVRIFFHSGPTGGVTVENEDGAGTFTGANQKYYQYDQMLSPGERSLPATWTFTMPDGDDFTFTVYVRAAVPDEGTIEEGLPGSTTKLVANSISAGREHTCGITAAGDAYCWGSMDRGKLGNGAVIGHVTSPDAVLDGAAPAGARWAVVSAAILSTCGITWDGEAYCWGWDDFGQLGNGATTGRQSAPSAVANGAAPSGVKWADISAGDYHTCGVTTEGEAYCWGYNPAGQLGNGMTTGIQTSPVAVVTGDAPAGAKWATISVGEYHTCGMTTEGEAYCWGFDLYGQVGNGGITGNPAAPSALATGDAPIGTRWAAISTGPFHSCGIATDGAAYCWGDGSSGKLGDGGTDNQPSPSRVIDGDAGVGATWGAISGGSNHTCAITTGGEAYCWGNDGNGRLGNGEGITAHQDSPAALASGDAPAATWAAISAGYAHTCGTTTDGDPYCWGFASTGRLGNGATSGDYQSPSAVDGSHTFALLNPEPVLCPAAALLPGSTCALARYAAADPAPPAGPLRPEPRV